MYQIYYFMVFLMIITFILTISKTYINRKKYKQDKNNKIVIEKFSAFNILHLSISIAFLILFIYFNVRFILSYNKVRNLLIPNYLSHWYNLFQLSKIDEVINILYLKDDMSTMGSIMLYLEDLLGFIFSIILLLISTYLINANINSIYLYKDEIYVKGVFYKINKIISYKWSKCFSKDILELSLKDEKNETISLKLFVSKEKDEIKDELFLGGKSNE